MSNRWPISKNYIVLCHTIVVRELPNLIIPTPSEFVFDMPLDKLQLSNFWIIAQQYMELSKSLIDAMIKPTVIEIVKLDSQLY